MRYDLHIHSCLSPCADNDMTPATIIGMAKLAGVDVVAIADHNTARNLPFAAIACREYGVKLIPAIEVTTQEEVHILCYFDTVENALLAGEELYASLPDIKCDTVIYGDQIICDEHDNNVGTLSKLLITATGFDVYDTFNLAKKYNGIAVPAHIDKNSYSVLSVLGFMPDDINFTAVEVKDVTNLETFIKRGQLEDIYEVISSSDAHTLEQIACKEKILNENSCLYKLIQ